MSRVVWISGGVGVVLLLALSLAARWASTPAEPEASRGVRDTPSRRVLAIAPQPSPAEAPPSRMVRFSMGAVDPDLPKLDVRTLRGGAELHREVTETLQAKVLRPCRPPHSLKGEDRKHLVRLLYTLGPNGLTEFSVTPLDSTTVAESSEPVPASWLDCVQENLDGVALPGVEGSLTHGLVYSWRERL